jgi:hypothetical protein
MVLMRSLVEFVIIFVTTETPNTINSRTLVLASFGGGKLTVKCPSPETLRAFIGANNFQLWPRLQDYDEDIIRVWIYGVDCLRAGLNKFGNVSYGSVLTSGGLAQAELLVEEQEREPGSNHPSTPNYSIF